MERLHAALDTLLEETCQGLTYPKCVRKAAIKSDLTLSKSEADEITRKIVSAFRTKCEERVIELITDTEIEQKLANLKVLTESCKKKNEELGIVDGYRSISPLEDIEGPMHRVLEGYHASLLRANESLQKTIEDSRESLKNAAERVNTLAQMAESSMKTS
ncbi:unnamed protein product [Haemonchus placei]|uniref:Tubulin-specific chaperone A n=1 Tax=Haemonchus placei TaxID=6290 RepID=A0A0N4WQP9_HAEPC|nr:unnamed protein product [Haemonchus placei]